MINKVILLGDVWKDPTERTTTKNETTMCILNMVTKELITDKNNTNVENKVYTEKKEWHTVVCFGHTAQYVIKNIKTGDIVYVEGQIQTREVVDESGTKKYIRDIIINRNGNVKKVISKKPRENLQDNTTENVTTENVDTDTDTDLDLVF